MDSVAPELGPITYRLGLGEDWYRIRLDEHAEADVKAFLDVMFDGLPADAAEQVRTLLSVRFATQIAAARARRGIEMLVPAPKPGGAALPGAAVLIAEVVIPTSVVPDPVEVAARVAQGSAGARTGVVAGSVAVRIDHTAADTEADGEDGEPESSTPKRIEYVVAVPNDPRWLSIDLSVRAVEGFDVERMIAEFDEAVAGLDWSEAE
ncbi:hypothetical protein KGQ20_24455 [Catenulispora sp. NF23]|uniref:Uncharacterized protein n=1 Tax=Catenulispora pinistramenti TaxID=2705254 RepID=A0ABS5KJI9_9ACTN|nr:hypothetical protein [Catenulispora pinistramenti]MBS2535919.1 hypothetical protein [Catenulispora pinistramenti]MBS2546277.1 hypothetical protein [Catenulispora pinistramenti]